MSEIICTFDHLLTQLIFIGLKVKVSKCQSAIFGVHEGSLQAYKFFRATLWSQMAYAFWVCQWVLRTLSRIFWMRFYFRTWCISMIFSPRRSSHVALGILFSCVTCRPSYLTWIVPLSSSFLFLLAGFEMKIMQVCKDIMGPRS
jgi:hypothetical protein